MLLSCKAARLHVSQVCHALFHMLLVYHYTGFYHPKIGFLPLCFHSLVLQTHSATMPLLGLCAMLFVTGGELGLRMVMRLSEKILLAAFPL